VNLNDIHNIIGGEIMNKDDSIQFTGIKPLELASENDVVFLFSKIPNPIETKSKLIVTKKRVPFDCIQILHSQPRLAMAKLLKALYFQNNRCTHFIHTMTSIDASSILNDPVNIHAFVNIGKNCTIGKNTVIHSNVSIGNHCSIGENCTLYPNVTLYDNVEIGNNATIHSSAVIGSDGFGFEKSDNHWHKIPHIGKVVIGDNVDVGSNTSIDRGCLTETKVGCGVKIDNLVQLAHNCTIGEHTVIAAGSLIGGSASIGRECIIAGDVSVKDNVTIGDQCVVLGKSGVTKNMPSGSYVSGFPAINHKENIKRDAFLNRLFKSND
jgi:UDP-3-O-[3-hydroxymyristoyl] glucosamine N-acyltransferase